MLIIEGLAVAALVAAEFGAVYLFLRLFRLIPTDPSKVRISQFDGFYGDCGDGGDCGG